jgi:uncharacterized protein
MVTASVVAVSMHVARLAAYGVGGAVGARTFVDAAFIALAILVGNASGRRLRAPLGLCGESRRSTRLTYGVLAVSIALAVVGLA